MRIRLCIAVALVLCACPKPPTPEELAEQTASDLDTFWQEAVATARVTNVMQVREEFFTNIEGLQRNPPTSRPVIPDSSTTDDSFADLRVLTRRVFTQGNVTQSGGSSMSFRVNGVDLCTPLRGSVNTDTQCVNNVDRLKLAIRVSGLSAGYEMTLLIDDSIELGSVQIAKDVSVTVTTDLANARAAAEFVNRALGTDSPFRDVTFDGSGKVEAKLRKYGPSDFEATVALLSDVSGTVVDSKGFARSGRSAARNPVAALRIDALNKDITSTVDVGSSEFRGVWSDFFGSQLTSPMVWTLSGLTVKSHLKDSEAPTFGIGLGSGPNTLSFGSETVTSVTLNPSASNRFDLDFSTGSSGLYAVTARPGINAAIAFNFQPVANAGMTGIDAQLLSSTYTYELSSSDQAPVFELNRPTANIDASLKLTRGSFTLSGSGSPRSFAATSCLAFRRYVSSSSGMNAFLDLWMPCEQCTSDLCGGPALCKPTNCSGCCTASNVCYSGTSDSTCGSGGNVCADCSASALRCVSAVCR